MPLYTPYDTQWLTRASFEPTAARRIRNSLLVVVAALALIATGGIGVSRIRERLAPPARLAEITRQNAALGEALERSRMELKMERATRAELQRQIDGMGQQITELNHQLEFLNSRNVQPNRAN